MVGLNGLHDFLAVRTGFVDDQHDINKALAREDLRIGQVNDKTRLKFSLHQPGDELFTGTACPTIPGDCHMKTVTMLLALFALASCIAEPRTEFMGPNGKMVYAITCSGWGQTMEDCEKEARELCPGGHDTIPLASGGNAVSANGGIGHTPAQKLAIECTSPLR
jgi:hypothetical protein